jgi:SP family galactose:H+ symporter-like MFS transporter
MRRFSILKRRFLLILSQPYSTEGNPRIVYVVAALSALGGMLFGYDTGVISGAILFIRQDFALSDFTVGLVVSAVLIGAVIGAAIGGDVSDHFGRRKVIIAAAVIFLLGAVGTATVPDVSLLILGRIAVGVAIGIASEVTPLYISEMSPSRMRGSLVSLNQLAITIGIVVSYLVDFSLSAFQAWRYMLGLAAIPAIILGIGMLPLPDTPRWLINHNEADKARKVLKRIRGKDDVEGEVKEIQDGLKKQRGGRAELFNPLVKPALIIGVSLAIFQQVTGINTVIYYAPTIFQFAGITSASSAILATVAVGVVNVILTIVAILLLDRVGRRPLLLIGLAGMTLSLTLLGAIFFLPSLLSSLGDLAVVGLMLYVASFAIGLGPVFWLLISEIYPLRVRGLAMSIASEANWGSNLIIALTFLTLVQVLGRSGTFWLYALVGVGAWIFAYLLIPETKGKTLEQIEDHWRKGLHPREMGRKRND